jgi:cephalosporin hydroxylase
MSVGNEITVQNRSFKPQLEHSVFDTVQMGTMKTTYRNIPFLKSPFDIGIYLQLIGKLMPKTVFEIGTKNGGSALFFADMLSVHGIENASVVSLDIKPLAEFEDNRITFLQGDAKSLGETMSEEMLNRPHPWLIIEDSSHFYEDTTAVIAFFEPKMQIGDYLIVEDGIVDFLSGDHYRVYKNGPNKAVFDFFNENPDTFEIDGELCDHYGNNVTYNPNGYLRKI